jgi:tRNA-specific adenosine deaminase 3
MVHLKTKEECRLGNETIQVWTVELPSKYAEGILRYQTSQHFLIAESCWPELIK